MRLIDLYFNFASFYKSTGDGLLFTIPFNESNLKEMVRKTVAACLACHADFGDICVGDAMINFEVPKKVGIGISRGTACCLISGENTIDYSGRLLNLTSRLTALARPSGIVIDQSLGIDLLSESLGRNFEKQNVYLDGIAESEPMQVYFTKKFTTIPGRNREPITAEKWHHVEDNRSFGDILTCKQWFRYSLESEPVSAGDVKVTVTYPSVTDGKLDERFRTVYRFADFEYRRDADKPTVRLNFPALSKELLADGVSADMNVHIDIAYVEK